MLVNVLLYCGIFSVIAVAVLNLALPMFFHEYEIFWMFRRNKKHVQLLRDREKLENELNNEYIRSDMVDMYMKQNEIAAKNKDKIESDNK